MTDSFPRWLAVGTALQLAMVFVGHYVPSVANLFGPLGMLISALVGYLYGRELPGGRGAAAGGGALVGGGCALVGILASWLLGDVTAMILLIGTLSSAVTGAIGGALASR